MVKFRITMETAFRVIKFVTSASASWPLPADAKPSDVWRQNLRWWFLCLNTGWCTGIEIYNIYLRRNSFDDAMICVMELLAIISILSKVMICKLEAKSLQGLLAEFHMFLKRANKEEMETMQHYADKCSAVYLTGYVFFCVGPLLFMASPLVLPQPFPSDNEYPFSTESFWVWLIAYCSQSFLLFQVSATMSMTYMYAMLLWFTVAKFEINCLEFQRATSGDDLRRCILNHQQLMEYSNRLRLTTRPMALNIVVVTVFSVTIGGFMLTRDPPLFDGCKYASYYFGSTLQFFTLAWPADNLMDMSMKIGDSAYSSGWVGKPKMLKDIIIIVQRSQIPLDISYQGLLPSVSLNLFKVGMSATFSYLATLRAMADG